MECTFVLLKPDCIQRRLMWEVIRRIENKGFNIVAMKMMFITPELARQHYAEHVDKPFYSGLETYITGAPVLAMVVEGLEAIRLIRDMVGATDGRQAVAGTIRGDFSISGQRNLVHASDGPDSAKREIDLYFRAADICSYKPTINVWLQREDEG